MSESAETSPPLAVPYDPSFGLTVTLNNEFRNGIYMPSGSTISAGSGYPLPITVTVEKRDAPNASYRVQGCPVSIVILTKSNPALNLILLNPTNGVRLPVGTLITTDASGNAPVAFTIVGGIGQVEMRLTTGLVLASSQYAVHTDFPLNVVGPVIPAPPPPVVPPPVVAPPPITAPIPLTVQQVLDIWQREGWWVGKVPPPVPPATVIPDREWGVCLAGQAPLQMIAMAPTALDAIYTAITVLGVNP